MKLRKKVLFAKTTEDARLPEYSKSKDVGFDFFALGRTVILPGERKYVSTGVRAVIPEDHEIQVRPRSGVAGKTYLTVHFGTVDPEYRGEIKIIVENTSGTYAVIEPGHRIAQGVLAPVVRADIKEISMEEFLQYELTERGGDGLGSTGGFDSKE